MGAAVAVGGKISTTALSVGVSVGVISAEPTLIIPTIQVKVPRTRRTAQRVSELIYYCTSR